MFNLFQPRRNRMAMRILQNTLAIEKTADAGAWEECGVFAARQDPLLAAYLECPGASDEHLQSALNKHGLPRSLREPDYQAWICDELFRRGLQPP